MFTAACATTVATFLSWVSLALATGADNPIAMGALLNVGSLAMGDFGQEMVSTIARWVSEGYQQRPVLMVGLGALLLLPPLALVGWFVLGRRSDAGDAEVPSSLGDAGVPRQAWIEIEGVKPNRRSLNRELIRIGREADNEICLEEGTVHRYHAIIERTWDAGYFITDVSGPHGNGLLVNGKRRQKIGLSDGDVVQLGRARMRFAAPI